MTMADSIAVMNRGKIEQLAGPEELYERPATAFVAGFLGVSNLLPASVEGPGVLRLANGTVIKADTNGHSGRVAAGVRPEKIALGAGGGENVLGGTIAETAYIGVATQIVVDTPAGTVQVFAQNTGGAAVPPPGSQVTLSWDSKETFVVERAEEEDTA
jgi:spermidine/putrescine transport system ATP-binding protein